MRITNRDLKRRILEISHKHKLSHLSSCLTAVDIIDEIYGKKGEADPFILSSGHAGLALYVVLEKYYSINAEEIWEHHGVHPDRCFNHALYFSSGSLGHGLGAAVGMALANRNQDVWVLVSDGECAEGSIWEALRIVEEQRLYNIHIYFNVNGVSAYQEIDRLKLIQRIGSFLDPLKQFEIDYDIRSTHVQYELLEGIQGHYKVLSNKEYKLLMSL